MHPGPISDNGAHDASITLIAMPDIFRGIHLDPLVPGNSFYLLRMPRSRSPEILWRYGLRALVPRPAPRPGLDQPKTIDCD